MLPALVPEMTYEGMEVADGQAAGLAWESLVGGDCSEAERQQKQEGAAGLLWAGHAGDGAPSREPSANLKVTFAAEGLLHSSEYNNALTRRSSSELTHLLSTVATEAYSD